MNYSSIHDMLLNCLCDSVYFSPPLSFSLNNNAKDLLSKWYGMHECRDCFEGNYLFFLTYTQFTIIFGFLNNNAKDLLWGDMEYMNIENCFIGNYLFFLTYNQFNIVFGLPFCKTSYVPKNIFPFQNSLRAKFLPCYIEWC